MTQTRRLAAILAADVVGRRMMREDEAGIARGVREHREAATPSHRTAHSRHQHARSGSRCHRSHWGYRP